jgi:sulfotransferase family protein
MVKFATANIKNWVFVTGVPRSGTTFLGMMLSSPLEVDYIHEPFSPRCGIPGMTERYQYVRPGLATDEMQHYHSIIKRIFDYDFSLTTYIPRKDSWHRRLIKRVVGSRGPFYLRLAKVNPFHSSVVIKDSIGLLLTEYLYLHFGVKPVIIIRHPTSVVASLKRMGWRPSPAALGGTNQPYLIEDFFSEEAEFLTREWSSPLLEAAAFWRAAYKVLLLQADKYPDWTVIVHEKLSQDPISTLKHLYDVLELPWGEASRHKILRLTQDNRTAEARGRGHDFRRNSADIFEKRRNSISLREREAIFEVVKDVALKVYTRESFAID